MKTISRDDLVVKESDYQKLTGLIDLANNGIARKLEDELSRADIVQDELYPDDAVCMGSTVKFVELTTGKESVITLVYPGESSVDDMKISILTPMGSALIGMRVGGEIDWSLPNGRSARIKVLSMTQNALE